MREMIIGGVLAQAVQDNAQGVLAHLVGVAGDADGAFGGGKGLVAGQERRSTRSPRRSSMAPRLPWPRPTWRCSATEPGMQKACRPSPMASAASAAVFTPFFKAMAAPSVVSPLRRFQTQMGCTPLTILSSVNALGVVAELSSFLQKSLKPYFVQNGLDLGHASFVTFKQ